MNTITPSDNLFTRLWKKANALARNITRLVGVSLQGRLAAENAEQSIEEFERLSGTANSSGWHFDRNEIHERR